MMKFPKVILLLVVAITLLVTACGEEQVGPDTGRKPTATATMLAKATEPAKGVTPGVSAATNTPPRATTPVGPGPVAATPTAKGNKVILATTSDLKHLNPLMSTSWIVSSLAGLAVEGLVEVDATGKFVPVLADGLPTLSADGLTLTYKLKSGVKFANGDSFTCADVKFTYQAALAKGSRYRGMYEDIASVDCPNDTTAVVKFSQPYADYLQLFSYILPKAAGDPANMENWRYNQNPFGTGPFAVAEWKEKDVIVFGTNKNYRERGKPALDGVEVRFVSSTKTALKDLTAGQVDIVLNLNEEDIKEVKALSAQQVNFVTTPDGQAMSLLFNLGNPKVDGADPAKNPHPILSDLKVRQAIQAGINKAQLVKDFFESYTKPAASILNVGPFACQMKPSAFSASEAKSLLDSAGWHAGSDGIRRKGNDRLSLTLKTYTSESARLNEDIAKAIATMMKDIGIEVKVEVVGYREFMASWENQGLRKHGDFDLLLFVTGPVGVDPDKYLEDNFHSAKIPIAANKGEGANFSRYASKDMDALITKVAGMPDSKARNQTYCQIATLIANDLPRILLYETLEVTAYHGNLQNFKVSPGPKDFSFGAADWTLKK